MCSPPSRSIPNQKHFRAPSFVGIDTAVPATQNTNTPPQHNYLNRIIISSSTSSPSFHPPPSLPPPPSPPTPTAFSPSSLPLSNPPELIFMDNGLYPSLSVPTTTTAFQNKSDEDEAKHDSLVSFQRRSSKTLLETPRRDCRRRIKRKKTMEVVRQKKDDHQDRHAATVNSSSGGDGEREGEEEEKAEVEVEVERKIVALQRIVPGGETLGMDKLFEETAGYIMALQSQIKTMRLLSTFLESLNKERMKFGG